VRRLQIHNLHGIKTLLHDLMKKLEAFLSARNEDSRDICSRILSPSVSVASRSKTPSPLRHRKSIEPVQCFAGDVVYRWKMAPLNQDPVFRLGPQVLIEGLLR